MDKITLFFKLVFLICGSLNPNNNHLFLLLASRFEKITKIVRVFPDQLLSLSLSLKQKHPTHPAIEIELGDRGLNLASVNAILYYQDQAKQQFSSVHLQHHIY